MNVVNCFISFLLGIISYLPGHYLYAVMGNWALPKFIKQFMKDNGTFGIITVDILVISFPFFITYLLIAFILFSIKLSKKQLLFIFYCAGWLLPSTYTLFQINGFVNNFSEWPHLILMHFMPLIGATVGFILSRKNDS